MSETKEIPAKIKRNRDLPLLPELGDLSPLSELRGPKTPSNRQVLRFFLFLLSLGRSASSAAEEVVDQVLTKHPETTDRKSSRRLQLDVIALNSKARLLFLFYVEGALRKNINRCADTLVLTHSCADTLVLTHSCADTLMC